MPVQVSYPGVYVEELPSSAKTVTGVSTSDTAFVDFFKRGPMNPDDASQATAVRIASFREFQRTFGGLDPRSEASYQIMQYFTNGGEIAWVIRAGDGNAQSSFNYVKVRVPALNDLASDANTAAANAQKAARAANITAANLASKMADEELAAIQTVKPPADLYPHDIQNLLAQTQGYYADALSAVQNADVFSGASQATADHLTPIQPSTSAKPFSSATKTEMALAVAPIRAAFQAASAEAGVAAVASDQDDFEKEKATLDEIDDFSDPNVQTAINNALTVYKGAAAKALKAAKAKDLSKGYASAQVDVDAAKAANGQVRKPTDNKNIASAITALAAAKKSVDAAVKGGIANAFATATVAALLKSDGITDAELEAWLSGDVALGLTGQDKSKAVAYASEQVAEFVRVAADEVRVAAVSADSAGKLLASALSVEEAQFGPVARSTESLAKAAGDAAVEATEAADVAAAGAQDASDQGTGGVTLVDADAAGKTVMGNAQAAENATNAALKATYAANAAHQAALSDAAQAGGPAMKVSGANPGVWGNNLRVAVVPQLGHKFDLLVREIAVRHGRTKTVSSEVFRGLTLQDQHDPKYAPALVNHQSKLVSLEFNSELAIPGTQPDDDSLAGADESNLNLAMFTKLTLGNDGGKPGAMDLITAMQGGLKNIAPEIFNILCLPITSTYPGGEAVFAIDNALEFCLKQRAFMVVDIPQNVNSTADMQKWMKAYGNAANYSGAVYYPRVMLPDPLRAYRPRNSPASGTIAGIMARTDSNRGIWKAPAGIEAVLEGVTKLTAKVHDVEDDGVLNPLGVNCLRTFPVYGNVCWGARTLAGADLIDSQWKYVNVRRLFDYVEESLFKNLKWAVFEDNDEHLWREISQEVGGFLQGLFADGAFAGDSPSKAYFVHCDATTTSPEEIANGIVNVVIGIAPVKPAEFVILEFEQLAGQSA